MKTILGLAMAALLIQSAHAASGPTLRATDPGPLVRVEGGCGPAFHRGPDGYCRPNYRDWEERRREERRERWEGRVCPRGYHLGPRGERCWPN